MIKKILSGVATPLPLKMFMGFSAVLGTLFVGGVRAKGQSPEDTMARYIHKTYVGRTINPENPNRPESGFVMITEKATGMIRQLYLSTNYEYIPWYR